MVRDLVPSRRLLGAIAVAAAVGTATAAGVGFAQAGASPTGRSAPAAQSAPGGILAGIPDALARLVTQGTINQQQADAVQQQANSGSIDPKTLTASGVVSDAQMRVIADAIDQLKQASGS